ncbi:OmpA family protein [Marinimicrobium sp. ABcell2]|uniref:OmpA family protein n=1 Tax=Marinimicrobium sp. ABcell2 TaxID=3069751 RepID=UPI0027B66B2F|nr:OmpA family protein [Marinimicrobium sp. ABcell2]MDQ2078304.1 OmpA family protein [Marinimicrobium sp. ABcell2]
MKYLVVLCAIVFLTACATTDPYTGEDKASRTATGAGIGAVAGAVIGAASASRSDRARGALTGAVAGGAIGGGVGYYMDRQEAKLREELQGTGVQVRREGDKLYLVMPGNITFATGRHEIRSEFYPVLNSVAKVVNEFNQTIVVVSGHTDSTGSAQLNQTLSENRAQSVADYLAARDVSRMRMETYGFGPRYPVATNATAEGRQENRRVELELVPVE